MLLHSDWRAHFPALAMISPDLGDLLDRRTRRAVFDRGTVLFGPGRPAADLLLMVSGCVRVQKVSHDGREIVLYRLNAGEGCVLTTACLLAFDDIATESVAETEVEAILMPRDVFDRMMSVSGDFRAFVFDAYARRVTDLFKVIEEVAFTRMDIRVAQKLLELTGRSGILCLNHQQLARELGTAREVVSRQLKDFERRGWLTLRRGRIGLRDRAAMERLAQTADEIAPPGNRLPDQPRLAAQQ